MSEFGVLGLALGVMAGMYLCYQAEKYRGKRNKKRELTLKGATTLIAAALALYGFSLRPLPGHFLIALGLCVCAAADVVLDLHFLGGMICFGAGHLCYCAAYVLLSPPGWPSAVLFMLFCGCVGALYPTIKKLAGRGTPLPYVGYALVIGAMLALALPQKPVLLCGAVLFVVSDVMLLFSIVKRIPSKAYDYVCLGCYFLAQFLIGASTLV